MFRRLAGGFLWALGALALTLAGLNSYLATHATTCTQGDADVLAGGVLSGALYLFGFALIAFFPLRREAWLLLLPALAGILYHVGFTLFLVVGIFVLDMSACEIIKGDEFKDDPRQGLFALLWAATLVPVFAGLPMAWRRSR